MSSTAADEIRKSLVALMEAQEAQLQLLGKLLMVVDPPTTGRKNPDGSWTYSSVGNGYGRRFKFYWTGVDGD